MIRGYFRGESPFVAARLSVPRLAAREANVEFLVDTGSAITVINRSTFETLAIDDDDVRFLPVDRFIAASGGVSYRRLRSDLAFVDEDDVHPPFRFFVRVPILAAPPTDEPPSVLGMDFLAGFRVIVSVPENLVEIVSLR